LSFKKNKKKKNKIPTTDTFSQVKSWQLARPILAKQHQF